MQALNDWIEMEEKDSVPLPHEYMVDTDMIPRISMDKVVNASGELLLTASIYSYI